MIDDGNNDGRDNRSFAGLETRASIQRLLRKRGICSEAIEWAADKDSFEMMWMDCQQAEWMLWALEHLEYVHDPRLRLFAAACARRHTRKSADSERYIRFVETAEAVAGGLADRDELKNARDDAEAAADEAASNPDLSVARRAAMITACDCVRLSPLEAARCASGNGQQASACIIKESQWQADELRRIFEQELPFIIERARRLLART